MEKVIKVKDIGSYLESIAPSPLQESYDNSGLMVGNPDAPVKKILVSLDITEQVVDEAIRENCQLIVAHHPVIFKGLKKLTGASYVERVVLKAIKHDIALYSIHTNLDNIYKGVNYKIAQKLGLFDLKILSPKPDTLKKLITFVPAADTEQVLQALYKVGAGNIGNYSECSFRTSGTGTFRPDEEAAPAIGTNNKLEYVEENRVEVIFPSWLENKVVSALYQAHPYEEPAFDVILLSNKNPYTGAGMIGMVGENISEHDFLLSLKEKLNVKVIRHTSFLGRKVKTVAVCGGSGSFLLKDAIARGADIFITADFKYHEFFDAENKILIADVGHYESEYYTKELIYEYLIQKFSNIAVIFTKIVTNPISYL